MTAVWWKCGAALLLAPLMFDGPRRRLHAIAGASSRRALVAAFAASRLAACVLVFVVLDFALPSDVRGYYATFADAVLQGGRHEQSPYSPGFDHVLAALKWLSPGLLGVVVAMVVAEIGAFALVMSLGDGERPSWGTSMATVWLLSPVSLLHVALGGQDEALVLLTWAAVALLIVRGRSVAAGIVVAVGVAGTKLLGAFAALPAIGQPAHRLWRMGAAATLACGAVAAVCISTGVPLGNVLSEAVLTTSGNLWAVPAIVSGTGTPRPAPVLSLLALVTLASAALYLHWRPWPRTVDQMLRVSGTIGCLFLLLSPKAFTYYLVMFLPGVFFLALQAPAAVRTFVLVVALPIAAFEPSLWFEYREGAVLIDDVSARVVMMLADAPLLVGYGLVVREGLRAVPGEVVG